MCSAAEAPKEKWYPQEGELWIRIDKQRLKLDLIEGEDTILKTYGVAIGRGKGTVKKSRFDFITPAGEYTIWRVVQNAKNLVYDPKWFNEPGKPQKGVYGSKLISFHNNWKIALHGTNSPSSIGKRVTHGCIRMRNKDITELSKSVKPGMKLVIVEKLTSKVIKEEI